MRITSLAEVARTTAHVASRGSRCKVRVEIAAEASERFAEAVRQPDTKDKHIHIEPLDLS